MTAQISRRKFLGGVGAAGAGVAVSMAPGTSFAKGSRGATTIIVGGRVFVGDNKNTVYEAIAIGRDGSILDVGRYSDLRRYKTSNTNIVDAHGGTVMAGIQDGHAHPMYAGLRSLSPSLEDAELTGSEVQDLVGSFLLDPTFGSEPDSWLVVEGWNPAGTPTDSLPHKDILDSLPTARPIALNGSDGHNLWVNSKALALAGIDASTPDPTGGEIVHDGSGEPSGVLKDEAQGLVRNLIPGQTPEQMYQAFAWAFQQMAAGGITSVQDAWVERWQLPFYRSLATNGDLLQRIRPALLATTAQVSRPNEVLERVTRIAAKFGDIPLMRFGTVKVFMDGVIEYPAQTAALLEPYLDENGDATSNYGDLYADAETFGRLATKLDKAGWQVHAHAIGDAAVRAALDGYQRALQANGPRGNRHTIAHLQLVHPDDYSRFSELNVIPDMQLQWATRNVWTEEALEPFIGPERHARLYPAKSMLDAGAPLAGGSDWPVDPLYPWNQVQSAIDRFGIYGEDEPLYAEQGISRRQSLLMHTRGTAYQLHQLKRTGTLEAGKQADLVVLDRDITRCPVSEINQAVPQLTLLGGRPTFDIETASGRAASRKLQKAATGGVARQWSHGTATRHDGCPCTTGGRH